jgi:hypothetical protein
MTTGRDRRRGGPADRARLGGLWRAGSAPFILAGLLLLGPACGRNRTDREVIPQPVGDGSTFMTLLDAAMRRADPQGAVLVVLWTTDQEPPTALERLAEEWNHYGLIPVGVCLDIVTSASQDGAEPTGARGGRGTAAGSVPGKASRDVAIARVRSWERSHKGGIRGLIYEGDAGILERSLGLAKAGPSVALLSAQGAVLWSRAGFGGLDELEEMLNVHLGQPPLALAGRPSGGVPESSLPAV